MEIVNRKSKFEFEFLDSYTAGIVLTGVEVKFIRDGKLSFSDSYCQFQNGELFLKNVSISGIGTDDIKRDRKLLLNKRELNKIQRTFFSNTTIVPYKIFTNNKGLFKVEIMIAKGKKLYDKRETIKKRDLEREIH
jgi:SsrA-binding protein